MDDELQEKLRTLHFRSDPTIPGVMRGRIEDVKFGAVEHPLNGLCLTYWYRGDRTLVEPTDMFVPREASIALIASVMLFCFKSVHRTRFPEWNQHRELAHIIDQCNAVRSDKATT